MKSLLFTRKDVAELVEVPMPAPQKGEVRVKLVIDTVSSGTERANIAGVPDVGVGIFATGDPNKVTWPRLCGYSNSGIVDKVGEGVEDIKVGDRVAMSWARHQEFVCVPSKSVYPIPEGVSMSDAALAHIATFPLAAIRKCRLELGESAIVMGPGILGQLAVKLLKAAGATPVIAADPVSEKREEALKIGADFALDPTSSDFASEAKRLCKAEGKKVFGRVDASGPVVGIEVTGVGAGLDSCLDAIAPFGRISLLGCTRDSDFSIDYYHKIHGRGVTLVGAHTACRTASESAPGWWTERDDALTFLRLVALGRIDLTGFVKEIHSPKKCGEVFSRLVTDKSFPVVQFDWSTL